MQSIADRHFDLSASMMCADMRELGAETARLERSGIDSFHFDVMDGHFVPNLALSADIVAALRPLSKLKFVVHLMVDEPSAFIVPMAKAGCDELVFHIEATRRPQRLKAEIESLGMTAGIAISPATTISALESVKDIAALTIMTVEPGFAGQAFVTNSPERVERIRALLGPGPRICADGHIDLVTAPLLAAAGTNAFVCGTKSIFRGAHEALAYAEAVSALRSALRV
jgi:ribulose-phosphate 3-epimerase